jgi:hypothetical protein
MRTTVLLLAFVLLAVPAVTAQNSRPITAGMTTDEVRAALGAPDVVREADGWTYFFYTNRCLPRCGTDDTVFFRDGRVVSAMLHAPARRYSGPSAAPALGSAAAEPVDAGAQVIRIRVRAAEPVEEVPVNLGVISGRMRSATPTAAPASTPAGEEIVSVDTVFVPGMAPAQPEPAAPRRTDMRQGEPSDAEPRPARDGIAPNTIRRPPSR